VIALPAGTGKMTASRLMTIRREPRSDQSPQGQIRRIGKSANRAAGDPESKSGKQNQIRL
jgi:hypothetical protein